MKLRRLYSNLNHYFTPIIFNDGLNIILADIKLPENKEKTSHNLGKSTLARVIDFCLLGGVRKDHFLRKRADLFKEFVFFIELELNDGTFLTIRRAVANYSKISFLQSETTQPDATSLASDKWSHFELAFDRAKALLDGYLDLRDIDPWAFRNVIGYFLRTQADYDNVFKLQRHAGGDKDWKPTLARLLGLDATIFSDRYDLKSDIDTKASLLAQAEKSVGNGEVDPEKIDAIIQLREVEVARMQDELEGFDFEKFDKDKTTFVVDQIDVQIADLNQSRYALRHTISELERSIQAEEIIFDPKKAKALFEEAHVVFPDQIKVDFEQLIAFNRAITDERAEYIRNELGESKNQLGAIQAKLNELNAQRKRALAFLRSEDVFKKYRTLSVEIARTAADIDSLRRQHDTFVNIQEKRRELREAKARYAKLQGDAEATLRAASQKRTSLLAKVRECFSEIIKDVLSRDAILSITLNGEGNLDFRTDFVDGNEMSTSEADGTSYKKLLCVAFDLAVVRAHLGGAFPRFAFHDGVFEILDPRAKQNLLSVIRKHADLGVQSILTVMDFDLPNGPDALDADDIVLRLHDNGPSGRLFHFESW